MNIDNNTSVYAMVNGDIFCDYPARLGYVIIVVEIVLSQKD